MLCHDLTRRRFTTKVEAIAEGFYLSLDKLASACKAKDAEGTKKAYGESVAAFDQSVAHFQHPSSTFALRNCDPVLRGIAPGRSRS